VKLSHGVGLYRSSIDRFVLFPEKLLKMVATRGEIFSLTFTKYCLAAGLRLDPLWELKRSPDPLVALWAYF